MFLKTKNLHMLQSLNKSNILKSFCSFLSKKEKFINIISANISNSVDLDIVKTRMKGGFCCIGLNLEERPPRFYRPIFRDAPHQCCWPQEAPVVVGGFYGFKQAFKDIQNIPIKMMIFWFLMNSKL